MPTVFIDNRAITLPSRFKVGDECSYNSARVLNEVQIRRIKARLRWLLSKGDINGDEIQKRALELSEQELVPYATLDDTDDEDPILVEALNIARELIVSRMAQEGLPPPKGLDIHAKALVDGMPELQEKARLRIEAKYKAASQAIGGK
jgi:hypothetical protein